jgi:hypothetical protein
LASLTAPDREVDALIATTIGGYVYEKRDNDRKAWYYPTDSGGWRQQLYSAFSDKLPAYTASLDAAVALCERVLPGWSGDIDIGKPIADSGKVGARLFPPGDGWQNYSGVGPTPAIALLIAILTAKEARDGKD